MDGDGKVVIQPQFTQAGYFINGLALVAKNGRFGFINTKGEMVIPATYDTGSRFFNGIARMYRDGKPYFINTKGEVLFNHDFQQINLFSEKGFSVVTGKDGKKGLINRQGNIILEPIYNSIIFFDKEEIAIVEKGRRSYGVIDTNGNIVVPLDKFDRINYFINGFAFVEFSTDDEDDANDFDGFIDTSGNVVLKIKNQPWKFEYDEEYFSENIGVVDFFKKNPDSISDWQERKNNSYKGIIDTKGTIIKKDTSWAEMSSYSKERAFVKNRTTKNFRLIDTKGNYVGTNTFDEFAPNFYDEKPENFFNTNEVYVALDDAWGMIDRNGEYTVPLTNLTEEYDSFQQVGKYLVYRIEDENSYRYGFCNLKTNVIVPAKFSGINLDTVYDDLIHVQQNDVMMYLNQQGEVVWQEKESNSDVLKPFNILAMNRGYFYASSPSVDELNGLGGWGGSDNSFQKIEKKQQFPENAFGISIDTEAIVPYYKEYKGHKVYVYNATKDSIFFDAQDSRLYMNVQAKDENGLWKDIEYTPNSWCGNSYHSLFLAKKSFWEFTIPKYEGAIPTKLRIKLLYKTNHNDREDKIVYSEEFDGSVNPAQFWYKGEYTPSGIMDPYYD